MFDLSALCSSSARRARGTRSTLAETVARAGALLALLAAVGCHAAPARTSEAPPTRLDRRLGAKIDEIVRAHVPVDTVAAGIGPGMAVLVIRDGVVVHAEGYGLADITTMEPITRRTPFRLGSVTKQFTCEALLKLLAAGELDLDEPAARYVPSLERFGPELTIRRLMNHTAGLPDYYGELERRGYHIPSADDDPLLTTVDASALYRAWGDPLFAPGERFLYSNPGYEQLALIVEAVSGDSFGDYSRREILAPAGMATAAYRDRPERVIPGRAIGYVRMPDGTHREADDHPGNWILGAGGLYASLDDFYYWDRALQSSSIVPPEIQEQAYQPGVLLDGSATHYGLGWVVGTRNGHREYSHGGAWVGFRTHLSRFPDDGITVVVLANFARANPLRVAEEIIDLVLPAAGC